MKRLLLVAAIGCLPALTLGQTQGTTVSGQIREPGGNPVASVRVTLARLDGNNRGSAVTKNDGSFRIGAVPPGQYTVLAAAFVATILPGTADASQAVG